MITVEGCTNCGGLIGGKFKKFCCDKCRIEYISKKKLVNKPVADWATVKKKLSKTLKEAGELVIQPSIYRSKRNS